MLLISNIIMLLAGNLPTRVGRKLSANRDLGVLGGFGGPARRARKGRLAYVAGSAWSGRSDESDARSVRTESEEAWAILGIYFALVVAIGILARRAIATSEDFLLSGRAGRAGVGRVGSTRG